MMQGLAAGEVDRSRAYSGASVASNVDGKLVFCRAGRQAARRFHEGEVTR
jgi:hypothetical protein